MNRLGPRVVGFRVERVKEGYTVGKIKASVRTDGEPGGENVGWLAKRGDGRVTVTTSRAMPADSNVTASLQCVSSTTVFVGGMRAGYRPLSSGYRVDIVPRLTNWIIIRENRNFFAR